MKNCKNCGAEMQDNERFCQFCGTPAEDSAPIAPAQPVQPAAPEAPQQPNAYGYGINQQPYNPNQPYGQPMYPVAPAPKKSKVGIVIGIIIVLVVAIIVAIVVFSGDDNSSSGAKSTSGTIASEKTDKDDKEVSDVDIADKVGAISGDTYTNKYANVKIAAPDSSWSWEDYEDNYYDSVSEFTIKTDENGRKYAVEDDYSMYYEGMLLSENNSNLQILIMGSDKSSVDPKDFTDEIIEGFTESLDGKMINEGKEKLGDNEYDSKEYESETASYSLKIKLLTRPLDDRTMMVIIIVAIDDASYQSITKAIS